MGYFPICIELTGKTVYLVGDGAQVRDKAEKLKPFSPRLVFLSDVSPDDLAKNPALVIVGDRKYEEAERISRLCAARNIPVNVVDTPQLCTFFFPSLIAEGDLTISVSTGGKSPAAAAYLRRQIEENLPDRTEEILAWLGENRASLSKAGVLKDAVAMAFRLNRPLSMEECMDLGSSRECAL